jgi:hypothetical protein
LLVVVVVVDFFFCFPCCFLAGAWRSGEEVVRGVWRMVSLSHLTHHHQPTPLLCASRFSLHASSQSRYHHRSAMDLTWSYAEVLQAMQDRTAAASLF